MSKFFSSQYIILATYAYALDADIKSVASGARLMHSLVPSVPELLATGTSM